MRKYSFFAFLILVLAYGLFQARSLIFGPDLKIESPKAESTLSTGPIAISGRARNISFLSLNDRQIYTDTKGHFEEELVMQGGINIIKLYGRDRFGRGKTLLVRILAK